MNDDGSTGTDLSASTTGLDAASALIRAAYGAAAASIALVDDDALRYVAADGRGADVIVGTRLAAGRGIAGFVAATGQSVSVRDPSADPRFAHDVAAATGYVPSSILCLPVDHDGEVIAVVSILDRTSSSPNPVTVSDVVSALIGPGAPRDARATDTIVRRIDQLPAASRQAVLDAVVAIADALER